MKSLTLVLVVLLFAGTSRAQYNQVNDIPYRDAAEGYAKAPIDDILDDAAAAVAWTYKNIAKYNGSKQNSNGRYGIFQG
jgi:hypothetical protein